MNADTGYKKADLWLPKGKIRCGILKRALTVMSTEGEPHRAWSETENHLVVPREFIPREEWSDFPFPIIEVQEDESPDLDEIDLTYEPRSDVQRTAIDALIEGESGLLKLACGAGKTVISLHAWASVRKPMLIVVNTADLQRQWIERIEEHTSVQRQDIGWYAGARKKWERPITVASLQTLARRIQEGKLPEEFRQHFGIAVYDEVHTLGAKTFLPTANLCRGRRWGLSATPRRADGLDPLYRYHLGPELYENLKQELIPDSFFIRTGSTFTPSQWKAVRPAGVPNFQKVCELLGQDASRNELICEYIQQALDEDRYVLCLSRQIEHLERLHSAYKDVPEAGSRIIHAGVGDRERTARIKESRLLFATPNLARQALDKPRLDTLIVATPFKEPGWVQQAWGRIQRSHPQKKDPVALVFEDADISVSVKHCRRVRAALTSFGYPFTIVRNG